MYITLLFPIDWGVKLTPSADPEVTSAGLNPILKDHKGRLQKATSCPRHMTAHSVQIRLCRQVARSVLASIYQLCGYFMACVRPQRVRPPRAPATKMPAAPRWSVGRSTDLFSFCGSESGHMAGCSITRGWCLRHNGP